MNPRGTQLPISETLNWKRDFTEGQVMIIRVTENTWKCSHTYHKGTDVLFPGQNFWEYSRHSEEQKGVALGQVRISRDPLV